jgi:hypothetical protein
MTPVLSPFTWWYNLTFFSSSSLTHVWVHITSDQINYFLNCHNELPKQFMPISVVSFHYKNILKVSATSIHHSLNCTRFKWLPPRHSFLVWLDYSWHFVTSEGKFPSWNTNSFTGSLTYTTHVAQQTSFIDFSSLSFHKKLEVINLLDKDLWPHRNELKLRKMGNERHVLHVFSFSFFQTVPIVRLSIPMRVSRWIQNKQHVNNT